MKNPQVVIDSSVILSIILDDEEISEDINTLVEQYSKNKLILLAPNLLKLEVGNAIRSAMMSKRVTKEGALENFERFLNLVIYYEDVDTGKVLETSLEENLTMYDASYLALAREKGIPLVSLDKHLKKFCD